MKRAKHNKNLVLAILAGGWLFAGPCGITNLQLQDFVVSTAIRTTVNTLASVFESAFLESNVGNPES